METKKQPLRTWAKIAIFVVPATIIGLITYFAWPHIKSNESNPNGSNPSGSNLGKSRRANPDLVGGIDNFLGWAPAVAMNGGLGVNEDSRAYKEFGLKLEINILGEPDQQVAALKAGHVDFIFATTDIAPITMDEGSDLVMIEAQEFLELVDSRGGDVLVVAPGINSVEQLRGKKVACALGWPSNTMLDIILKAGGLTEHDVDIQNFSSPTDCKNAYCSGEVDACVVWSPDNFDCLDARPGSRELFTTANMPLAIVDVLVAKKSVLEKKRPAFEKLAKMWLTANAEVQNQGRYDWAARAYKEAFDDPSSVQDLVKGLMSFRFCTYGDNVNFFGLNPDYTGTTGSDIYNKMARVYKNGYENHLKNVTPWKQASNSSIIEAISGEMTGELHAAEPQISFLPISKESAKAMTPVIKRSMTVNFDVNSSKLSPQEQNAIRSFIGTTAKEFAGMRIRIEGNTDSTGPHDYNVRLSRDRAQAVKDYLVSEYGFDPDRFVVEGNGPDKPVASNNTEEGRAQNRRTDFEFLSE